MLFNSYEFIFVFMPITVLGFAVLSGRFHTAALAWLTAASLIFYASWEPRTSWILLVSIAFNFLIGWKINESQEPAARWFLILGVSANLLLLGVYKYAAFAVDIVNLIAGPRYSRPVIHLPLGISFFTFTQIAYLVDAYRREVRDHSALRYTLFVTYFPHLVAGPIIHHKPVLAQLADPKIARLRTINWVIGLIFFSIGLTKKLLIADPLGEIASPIFDAILQPGASMVSCWTGLTAYTFQIYFDFSGYSDMAVGLSLLFGVTIPINFLSPYKATSIIDFWRTWHISLSTFLRDYLYISLGGNRHGPARRYINLLLTMLLGGLWHGASWNYIVWGALHGIYLLINHVWRNVIGVPVQRLLGNLLTFAAVMFGWVFFRAADLSTALTMLKYMFSPSQLMHLPQWEWADDAALTASNPWYVLSLISFAAAIALVAPNSFQITTIVRSRLENPNIGRQRLVLGWAAAYGILLGVGIVFLGRPSPFLYFQF
jgi:D-alanyl-lipoteichoic acid acyltransferase DltB (MBOAT superfamily)